MTNDALSMIGQATGAEPVVLDGSRLRGQSRQRAFTVEGSRLAAYAAATADTRADRVAGSIASAAFGFVPLTPLLFEVVREVAGDVGPTGVVHTHQRFSISTPIAAGDEVVVDAAVAGLVGGPLGAVVTVRAVTSRADGTVLNTQSVRALVVGARVVQEIVAEDADPPVPPVGARPGGTASLLVDRELAVRYAAASGDENPIHVDAGYARAAGFPGPILHGMCSLALTAHALEALHPALRTPASLGVEWTRPVFPGDPLSVRYDAVPSAAGVDLHFEVLNRRRRPVMRGGLLALRP